MIEAFDKVLQDNSLPMYKPGHYGTYDPSKNRNIMTGEQMFDEDKIILVEMLGDIVFFDWMNRKRGIQSVDEFSRAVGTFKENRKHTTALDFAAQVHLDIQSTLRTTAEYGWSDMAKYAAHSRRSLETNFEFHKTLTVVDGWTKENDMILRRVMQNLGYWVEKDLIQDRKDDIVSAYSTLHTLPTRSANFMKFRKSGLVRFGADSVDPKLIVYRPPIPQRSRSRSSGATLCSVALCCLE